MSSSPYDSTVRSPHVTGLYCPPALERVLRVGESSSPTPHPHSCRAQMIFVRLKHYACTPVIVSLSFVSCVQVYRDRNFRKIKVSLLRAAIITAITARVDHDAISTYARVARRKLFGDDGNRQTAIVSLLKKTFTRRSTALGASRLTRARWIAYQREITTR